eukprot:2392441-Prymnesium_polylepis.1
MQATVNRLLESASRFESQRRVRALSAGEREALGADHGEVALRQSREVGGQVARLDHALVPLGFVRLAEAD